MAVCLIAGVVLSAKRLKPFETALATSRQNPLAIKTPHSKSKILVGDDSLKNTLPEKGWSMSEGAYWADLGEETKSRLTVVPRLQNIAQEALRKSRAPQAGVVILSLEGDILAMVGQKKGEDGWLNQPTLATQEWAPAASIFKVVTASALLAGGYSPDEEVCFHGGKRSVVESNLSDSAKWDSHCADLSYGIAHSQNAIIAKLATRHLTPRFLGDFAHKFGFGEPLRLALPANTGTVTTPKEPLEFAKLAAGFKHSRLSVIGGARIAQAIATQGLMMQPRLVNEVRTEGKRTPILAQKPVRILSNKKAKAVSDMMVETVKKGTARKAFNGPDSKGFWKEIKVAGKTGSLSRAKPSYIGYSWFVGFAPADSPKYIVSVLLGNEMSWHQKAPQVAERVLRLALKGDK